MFLQVSVCPQGGVSIPGEFSIPEGGFSIGGVLHSGGGGLHLVNVRAVRILLECILVFSESFVSHSVRVGVVVGIGYLGS